MIVVILVHSQKSYIETTTTVAISHIPNASDYTGSSATRRHWDSAHDSSSNEHALPIKVSVHELREIHAEQSSSSLKGGGGDESIALGKVSEETKYIRDVA